MIVAERVRVWDAALGAIASCLRGRGLRQIQTPPVVDEVALEPWIEPVGVGERFVQTSPELTMKRLLADGAGASFQLAAVARSGEHGQWHREQFVLLEWYRDAPALAAVRADAEAVIAAVAEALAPWRDVSVPVPSRWRTVAWLDALAQHTGVALRGDEDGDAVLRVCASRLRLPSLRARTPEARTLEAWTALFTALCDEALDPWLRARAAVGEGVHVVEFPAPLSALSEHERDGSGRAIAARFESHGFGRELCNGYRELRDGVEQRRRFDAVAQLREAVALPPLPMPEQFLALLEQGRLPPCAGAAMGVDRLVALAAGADSLDAIALVR
ncbi:MAG: amino acid--tRNA ligase-related protein [Nannocystaceae bacterium]